MAWLHRGKGIGTQLVRKLLERAQSVSTDVYLTTLQRSIPFYAPHGFAEVPLQSAPKCAPGMLRHRFFLNQESHHVLNLQGQRLGIPIT